MNAATPPYGVACGAFAHSSLSIPFPRPFMSVYDLDSFGERVSLAKRCIMSMNTNSRDFDTCFEMLDGAFVAVRLWQIAEGDMVFAGRLARVVPYNARLRALSKIVQGLSPRAISILAKILRNHNGNILAMYPHLAQCVD